MSDGWLGRLIGVGVTLVIFFVLWLMFAPCAHAECFAGWRETLAAHAGVARDAIRFSHYIKGHRGQKCWYAEGWRDAEPISRNGGTAARNAGTPKAVFNEAAISAGDDVRTVAANVNSQDTLTPADQAIDNRVSLAHAAFDGWPSVDLTRPSSSLSAPESFVLAVWRRWVRALGERLQVHLSAL